MLLILATKKNPNNLKQPKPVEFFDRGYTESLDRFGENFHFNNIESSYQWISILWHAFRNMYDITKYFQTILSYQWFSDK